MKIRFGTSGWRAVVANEFIGAQVGGVTDAICSKFADISQKSRSMIVAHDTRVGFKFIGELINEDKIILGGEESAGLSIKGHYPEKDGILACLLAAKALSARRASLTDRKVREIKRLDGCENNFPRRFMAVSASFGNGTAGAHLCGIGISEGRGGVA